MRDFFLGDGEFDVVKGIIVDDFAVSKRVNVVFGDSPVWVLRSCCKANHADLISSWMACLSFIRCQWFMDSNRLRLGNGLLTAINIGLILFIGPIGPFHNVTLLLCVAPRITNTATA